MISRRKSFHIVKAVAKGTLENLPTMLTLIPATAIAGKVLIEIKKIGEEVKATEEAQEKQLEDLNQLIEKYGGKAEFERKLREELKAERDAKNPMYINCAIFEVSAGDSLSEADQQKLIDTLMGDLEPETDKIAKFVDAFREDYFGDDYEACDNAVDIGEGYILFNFDDMSDHNYDEEDLVIICEYLNEIVGRDVFDGYEGFGTDDPCGF